MSHDHIDDGLRWLSSQFSASREEFQRAHGAQLLDGVLSHGYVRQNREGRIAVSDTGRKRLADVDAGRFDGVDE